ncbi:hypothetical protein ABEB36_006587 [Hypothenemus hampei]|uniref:CCR4-NOT transcription complex subunit 4 n=1 Tax=Hypothenemus hampei TaxID=57062 RepID=A0ABD1ER15_HYPHA
MSVLNQSGEEQVECPLCMEPLEVDDLNFFPCTCGYQICRFCWHRIRLDENGGLCPACRKAYSENPADFIPLSREQVTKLKAEKKQRNQQRKALLSESRKHLASVRVVQRNLVFVVGLPPRLADPEILKRHEYFGKFGKIHKVVINQSTSYAGSQGPSASAYVTYLKSDDALRAIQAVNNVTIDNRVIKSSLGTTKYCSHFMKNQPCPKTDCMYLHEYGDPEASFTREQMHLGRHQEYEKKLHDDLLARVKAQVAEVNNKTVAQKPKEIMLHNGTGGGSAKETTVNGGGTNKDSWPQLDKDKKQEKDKGRKGKTKTVVDNGRIKDKKDGSSSNCSSTDSKSQSSQDSRTTSTSSNGSQHTSSKMDTKDSDTYPSPGLSSEPSPSSSPPRTISPPMSLSNHHTLNLSDESCGDMSVTISAASFGTPPPSVLAMNGSRSPSSPSPFSVSNANNGNTSFAGSKLPSSLCGRSEDNNSYFSSSGFSKLHRNSLLEKDEDNSDGKGQDRNRRVGVDLVADRPMGDGLPDSREILTDALPNINTTEDWMAAFGFPGQQQSRESEFLQRQQQLQREKLSSFVDFMPLSVENVFGKGISDSFNEFFEISKPDGSMGAFPHKKNGYTNSRTLLESNAQQIPQSHISNGLDQNMSKFFSDFHKFSGKDSHVTGPLPYQNGYNGFHNNYHTVLQQKQLEEQFRNFGLKQQTQPILNVTQTPIYQNRVPTPSAYTNGDTSSLHMNGFYPKSHLGGGAPRNSEAELDFDPFQETQKAFADIIANESNHKPHNPNLNSGRPMKFNDIIHNQNNVHIPPPPPGFLQQQQTHNMNSFGSKILPFLSMSNSQNQLNGCTPLNWSNSLNSQMPPQKNLSNTCNDWKNLDPAILSSSRSFQLPQMAPNQQQQQQQQQQRAGDLYGMTQQQINGGGIPSLRPFDYAGNNSFSAFAQQLQQQQQPSFGGNSAFAHLNNQTQSVNWFATGTDLNSQISSPPGFRNGQQASKQQQEC